MATRLSVLPEDVARIVWRKVFDNVITEIKNRQVIVFYNGLFAGLEYEGETKAKQIKGLNKRYKTCKDKNNNRRKWDKCINDFTDILIRLSKLRELLVISLDAYEYFKNSDIKWFKSQYSHKTDRNEQYQHLKEVFQL